MFFLIDVSLNGGEIVAIILGGLFGVFFIIVSCLCLHKLIMENKSSPPVIYRGQQLPPMKIDPSATVLYGNSVFPANNLDRDPYWGPSYRGVVNVNPIYQGNNFHIDYYNRGPNRRNVS